MSTEANSIEGTSVTSETGPAPAVSDQEAQPPHSHARQHSANYIAATASMKNRRAGRLAWLLAVAAIASTLVAFGISVYFVIATGDSWTIILYSFLTLFITAAYAIIGALVAIRHPRNPIGWLFLAVSWLYGIGFIEDVYRNYGPLVGATTSLPWVLQNLWLPVVMLPSFVFLLFPDGRLISSRWRIVLWAAVLGLVGTLVAMLLHPGPVPVWDMESNPTGIAELAGSLDIVLQVARLLLGIGFVGSITAFVMRFRRSRNIERQQMKWLGYAVGLMLFSFSLSALTWSLWADNATATDLRSDLMTNIAILGIAVATGIAILRYRLYDIDVVINRTLVYGALTASVVMIYVLIVGGLETFVQAESSLLIALVATGLIAVLFQPLRDGLQRAVNRLSYGERNEPFEALARLGRRLESSFSAEMVYPAIVESVAQALKLPYAAITVRHGEGFDTAAGYGGDSQEPVAYPFTHQGEVIGQLLVGRRGLDENFSAADERLLRNFARQADTAVHAVQLTADLQRSRQQLVTAREEERLRLHRDLHDGLGPALASVVWQADSARDMIYTDPPEALQLLKGSIEQAQDALADIRRLVYGLRPPALDELGLVGA